MSKLFKKPTLYLLIIGIVGLIAYSNIFNAPFHFDDDPNIVKNNNLRNLGNFWPPKGSRWFGFFTFALNYHFGGLNVFGYHLVNLVIHILNAVLVYWFVVLTFKTPYFKGSVLSVSEQTQSPSATRRGGKTDTAPVPYSLIALFSGLLFVSHPIQTQAVTYIVQRFTSLATLFYLLAIVMYARARIEVETKVKFFSASTLTCYLLSLFSAVLAMKTKEISFTLPFLITLYEFMFFKGAFKKRLVYLLPALITILIIPLSMLELEKAVGEVIHDINKVTKVEMDGIQISRPDYLVTQFRVIVTYIRLLFLPVNQTLDYNYRLYKSFFEPGALLSFSFLLAILGFASCLFYRSRVGSHTSRLISFGIFWFFITLTVESSIIPIVHVIFEHRVYLPSIGVFIAFAASAAFAIQRWQRLKKTVLIALAIIVVIFAAASYTRNKIWGSAILLWEDGVRKAPLRVSPYYHLGVAYYEAGRLKEAIQVFNLASILGSDYPEIYLRKGLAYAELGWLDDAIQAYEAALKLRPDYKEAQYNLSVVYARKKALASNKAGIRKAAN